MTEVAFYERITISCKGEKKRKRKRVHPSLSVLSGYASVSIRPANESRKRRSSTSHRGGPDLRLFRIFGADRGAARCDAARRGAAQSGACTHDNGVDGDAGDRRGT